MIYNFVFFDTLLNRNTDSTRPKEIPKLKEQQPLAQEHNDWGNKPVVDNSISEKGT